MRCISSDRLSWKTNNVEKIYGYGPIGGILHGRIYGRIGVYRVKGNQKVVSWSNGLEFAKLK